MNVFNNLWLKLRQGKQYREEFVAQFSRQTIPFQIAALMKQYGLTQAQLASRSGLTQGVISRAVDPSYGNLTLRTLIRIAAGFDVAFIGRFVPFSELPRWFERLEKEPFTVPSFDEENTFQGGVSPLSPVAEAYSKAQAIGAANVTLKPPPRGKEYALAVSSDLGILSAFGSETGGTKEVARQVYIFPQMSGAGSIVSTLLGKSTAQSHAAELKGA